MFNGVLPSVGTAGIYQFAAPFDTLSIEGVEYTCQAIRRISDYLANNEDIKTSIYEGNNLGELAWEEDVAADNYIVSLQSRNGHWLYIPARYILTFPSTNGVPYRTVMIGVSLPSLPATQDLTNLQSEIKQLVDVSLGVNCTVKSVETSKVVLIDHEVHTAKQMERAIISMGQTSSIARLHAQQVLIDKLMQKVSALENFIKQNHL